MTLLEISLAFSLAFGPADAGFTLDVNPRIHLATEGFVTMPWAPADPRCGVAVPFVGITSTHARCFDTAETVRHEDGHLDQYEALGPALLLVAAASRGEAIEDYLGDHGSTWYPDEDQLGTCPLVRITGEGTTFAPCYNPWSLLSGSD